MAKVSTELSSGTCQACGERRKLERPATAWGLGDFLLTLMTLGVWLAVRNAMKGPWRCTVCGAKVEPS